MNNVTDIFNSIISKGYVISNTSGMTTIYLHQLPSFSDLYRKLLDQSRYGGMVNQIPIIKYNSEFIATIAEPDFIWNIISETEVSLQISEIVLISQITSAILNNTMNHRINLINNNTFITREFIDKKLKECHNVLDTIINDIKSNNSALRTIYQYNIEQNRKIMDIREQYRNNIKNYLNLFNNKVKIALDE